MARATVSESLLFLCVLSELEGVDSILMVVY